MIMLPCKNDSIDNNYNNYFLYPWVYSSQVLKAKKVKIKAGVTIGQERHRSRKCRAEEHS